MSYFNISPQKPLLSNEDEKVLKVSHFGGVDYTTSTLKMANNRAIDSLNYIRKSYVLEKRNGLNDELQIDGVIYDLWHFLDYLVIHWNGNISVYNYSNLSHIKTFENQVRSDTKIMAFESGEKLYILGGIKYLVLYREKYQFGADNILLEEASKLAYIPTTTIGINQDNYEGETSRSTLDDQNLLVDKVINELIGGSSIKTYYHTSGGEIFDTPQDGATSFENPNVVNKYILDRAIHFEENTNIINHLPQINIRYNWEDIIKIILNQTDDVKALYEYEVPNIDNSLTAEQTTFTFTYKAVFAYMYKNYDLSKLKWFFNETEQTKLKSLSVEREESFDIPSGSNSVEKTITTNVSYPTGEGDETTSSSVSKKVKVRKYQQRVYLIGQTCKPKVGSNPYETNSIECIYLFFVNSKTESDEKINELEIVYKGFTIKESNGVIVPYLSKPSDVGIYHTVKIGVSLTKLDIRFKSKRTYCFAKLVIYDYDENIPDFCFTNKNYNNSTYIKINGKKVENITLKTFIASSYYLELEEYETKVITPSDFYWVYKCNFFPPTIEKEKSYFLDNANKGIGVEYDP